MEMVFVGGVADGTVRPFVAEMAEMEIIVPLPAERPHLGPGIPVGEGDIYRWDGTIDEAGRHRFMWASKRRKAGGE